MKFVLDLSKKYLYKFFGKFWYLLVNNNIMGQGIILSENEKLNIHKMYGLINEQNEVDISSQLGELLKGGQIDDKSLEGIIPNLTEEVINNVAGGNLIEKLLSKGVSCDSLLKIYEMVPSHGHALSLSKKGGECGYSGNEMYYFVNDEAPHMFLKYVRSLYGKHLNSIITNNNIGSPVKEIFKIINQDSVNDISMLEKILRKYNEGDIVQAVNDIEDKDTRKEVVTMFKILYHHLGIDTYISPLDGIKLQGF